jgi:hypothetical protein
MKSLLRRSGRVLQCPLGHNRFPLGRTHIVSALQSKDVENTPVVGPGEGYRGKQQDIRKRGCWKELTVGFFGSLREGSGKQGFSLDWTLSGSGSNSMIGYFNNSHVKREKNQVRLRL